MLDLTLTILNILFITPFLFVRFLLDLTLAGVVGVFAAPLAAPPLAASPPLAAPPLAAGAMKHTHWFFS